MNARLFIIIAAAAATLGVAACSDNTAPDSTTVIQTPKGFPPVPVPPDNPVTTQKIALGRRLFYDPMLSLDNSISCASCHRQEHGFADLTPTSFGVRNEIGDRNSPAIANVGYAKVLFFDGRASLLDDQILGAITNPAEMRATEELVDQRLKNHPEYPALIHAAFGANAEVSTKNAVKAIASFTRTILSGDSPYDRYRSGDSAALNAAQKRGMSLFFSDKTRCPECHSGLNFSDEKFHSTGLYTHYYDVGRIAVSGREQDRGRFKTPTLRNIAVTNPYMHDGETFTLEDVMEHYNKGGKPFINKDSLIRPLNLTPAEISDVIAFLRALTDEKLLNNPAYSKP